ncbi:hypothetical protein [Vibrio methylphosphonaticus]|uniref:hypothetical protein n=1 Tax=Vibrio methylphosphonaticus TaxID=2946866 RepID=UPI00202A4468|nr:hypothetical protein [Vibrio methylphosphonaticus]MCL9775272.1 hypothetical protein [Vibrio methylphosphonaticus]
MSHQPETGIKALVDTPLKKVALAAFILTNIGMFAVPALVGALGTSMNWPAADTLSLAGISFAANEVVLFVSIAILGKPLVSMLKQKIQNILKPSSYK